MRANPDCIVDRMTESLFQDQYPLGTILYHGDNNLELVLSVERYCQKHDLEIPAGTIIQSTQSSDGPDISQCESELQIYTRNFLGDLSDLQTFDYIFCVSPAGATDPFSPEQQREYAYRFSLLNETGANSNGYMLYFEQALRLLAPEGRMVFLAPGEFRESEEAAQLRRFVNNYDIEEIRTASDDSGGESRVFTTVSNQHGAHRYSSPLDHETVNENLLAIYPVCAADVMTEHLVSCRPDDDAVDVLFRLLDRDFDAVPVLDENQCVGAITRSQLNSAAEDQVLDHMETDLMNCMIRPDTPASAFIEHLGKQRFLLVGSPGSVEGIITRFDLNHLGMYLHLYSLLANLEIGLRNAIRNAEVDLENHIDIYRTGMPAIYRRQKSIVPDKLACAQLSTLVEIADSIGIIERLEESAAGTVEMYDVELLRNHIAHYHALVHTMDDISSDNDTRTAWDFYEQYDFIHHCITQLEAL